MSKFAFLKQLTTENRIQPLNHKRNKIRTKKTQKEIFIKPYKPYKLHISI